MFFSVSCKVFRDKIQTNFKQYRRESYIEYIFGWLWAYERKTYPVTVPVLWFELKLISVFLAKASGVSREVAVQQVIQSVREFVGPVAAFKTAIVVPTLPKVS